MAHFLKVFSTIKNFVLKYYKFFVLIIFSLFLIRILGLDKDLPNFGLTYYQAKDEGQYSTIAINLYKYGNLSNTGDFILRISPTFRSNLLISIFQYVFMLIFGNNYFGLRIAYVLTSFITLILIYKIMIYINKEHFRNSKKNKIMILIILLYIVFDFSYLMASRVAEGSIVRAMSIALAIFVYFRIKNEKTKFFCIGFLGVLSIFFIYFSNVTIIVASVLLVIMTLFCKQWALAKLQILYGGLGIIVGLAVAEIVYILLWQTGCLTVMFESLFSFSDRLLLVEEQSYLTKLVKGIFIFFDSNLFFYNFLLLLLTIVSSFINIKVYFHTKNDKLLFILLLIFSVIIQSALTNDWMERKSICIYPAVILNVFFGINHINMASLKKKNQKLICLSLLIIISAILFMTMWRLHISRDYFLDFERADILVWSIFTILIVGLLSIFLFMSDKKIKKAIFGMVFLISCLLNCYFSFKYVYKMDNYTEKDAMIRIGEIAQDNYVVGPYSYGYSLYNNIKPVWNTIDITRGYIESEKIKFLCDYTKGPFYVEQIVNGRPYVLVDSMYRSLKAQGKEYPIGIFRKDW